MKKRILLVIALALFAGAVGAQQPDIFTSRDKVVFVDMERVFNSFYRTQHAKSQIEIQKKEVDKERQGLVDEMTAIDEEVNTLKKEARDMTLAKEIRDSKRILYEDRLIELREKQKEIEEFVELRRKQLQLQITRMSQKIMDEIQQTVMEYAKENGLMAVIDSSKRQAAVGVIVYTHPDVDITDNVLNMLNSQRPDMASEGNLLLGEDVEIEVPKDKTTEE